MLDSEVKNRVVHDLASRHAKIDADGHVYEPADLWQRYMPEALRDRGPKPVSSDLMASSTMIIDGKRIPKFEAGTKLWTEEHRQRFAKDRAAEYSPVRQVAGLDEEGIDASVVFPTRGLLVMGVDGVDPTVTTASAEAYNRWLSEFCSQSGGRIFGAAMIDPRNIDGARREARRALSDPCFSAVFLRPNPVNGYAWHDPVYDPLWSELEDLDVALCFHEGSSVLLPQVATDRFTEHALWHVCTHPMEQQMAMVSLLLGGVAERHPRLRMAFLECGAGWLPYWLWRMDEHFENEGRKFTSLSMKPSEYAQRQCWVSMDSDEHTGLSAVALGPLPRVVWGSDYPHHDGKFPLALKTLQGLPGMDSVNFRKVVCDAPRELFGGRLQVAIRKS